MAKVKPKLVQNIFEARYEHGYRYLDRCADTMVILEEALPKISTNSIWMPEDMRPQGARMKCQQRQGMATLVKRLGKEASESGERRQDGSLSANYTSEIFCSPDE